MCWLLAGVYLGFCGWFVSNELFLGVACFAKGKAQQIRNNNAYLTNHVSLTFPKYC